jgi:HEAT repeat protein/tRNA A-37 threonylcarbamoyl transferase component Bud32
MRVCTRCKALLRNDARTCPTDGAAAEEIEQLPKDTKLGNYKIERMLGEGGMGFVYEATHEVLNRRTAIKLLRPEFATHEQVVTRFLNEAKAVNLIDHQNIINVYDYGDGADGSVYFVMEFLEGETLDDLMRKRKPMALTLLLHTFTQIARALAAAHAKQIVHRDLKPANVYVIAREDNPYFIKLLDFGIAQLRGEGASKLTQAGSIMGTPQYMSPEQISGGAVDHRSDVWAMGVMLYRAATGHAPFKGEGFAELAGKILQESPRPVRELAPELPVELDKLIKSCLERNLSDRCQSIGELIAGFDRVKAAAKLDDAKILAAVREDAGAASEDAPATIAEQTRKSLAGSNLEYQGLDQKVLEQARSGQLPVRAKTPLPVAETSKTGLFVVAGLAVVGLGVGAYLAFGRGDSPPKAEAPAVVAAKPDPEPEPVAAPKTPKEAAELAIKEALASGNLQQQGQAVDALALVRNVSAAPHLFIALKGSPEIRVKAARALGELELPDAAPKVRTALAESGDKVKVELAAVLVKLGDKDALAILKRAVSDPGLRLVAAIALAEQNDAKTAKPVLDELLESTPVGREQWRRAAYGLLKLGEGKAKTALDGELAQPDAARAVAAAELLAHAGDGKAREYLKRVVADAEFARRADAAIALARLGDNSGASWLDTGFKSADVDERKLAIATSALLKDVTRDGELAKLAADDPDRSVRLVAAAALLARGN